MNDNSKKMLSLLVLWIAIISALFSVAVTAVLVADYYRIKKAQPLTSPALIQLRERLQDNPEDENLKKQIRELDFIARKAHFNSEARMKDGVILLLGGVLISLIAIQIYFSLNKKFVKPEKCPGMDNPFENSSKARLFISGAFLWILAAIVITVLFIDIDEPEKNNKSTEKQQIPEMAQFIQNWPDFRGLNGSSKIYTQNPPLKWDGLREKGIKWKTEIPVKGYSSPIVWKDKIFLTGGNKKTRKVFCFDSEKGDLLWSIDVPFMAPPGTKLPEVTEDTGFAAPTMTTDGVRVFAIFATGDLIALNFDGDIEWKKNLGVPDNHYAYSSSLLFVDGVVVVQFDDSTRTKVFAFNPSDGGIIWENDRKASISWASPIAVKINGQNSVITATSTVVSAMDAETGNTLWNTECMGGEMAPSPVFYDGKIFVANDYASAVALDAQSGKILWKNEDVDLPDVASPIASEGRCYLPASFGVLTCLDSNTGNVKWKKDFKNGFYSSPILVNDLIYLADMKGNMFIFKDADEYEEVSVNPLGELTVSVPAFVGNRIFIRGDKHLFCIEGIPQN